MGAHQAAATLLDLKVRDAERHGEPLTAEAKQKLNNDIRERYQEQTDIRYGAARGWVDAIIAPDETRQWLWESLRLIPKEMDQFYTVPDRVCPS
jgi:acetyl-CoA carboxylase carboxyltransferase component